MAIKQPYYSRIRTSRRRNSTLHRRPKEAWEKLRHFTLFKGINNITSTANAKITYVRDNGLSDTYETKRNVKENHYTKIETDSQISQTTDSIKESVKAINEQTQEKLATLELANQSLEFATKRTGGNNLVRNSAMINDNNFWLAHAKYPYKESNTPPDNPAEGTYWYCTANSGSYIKIKCMCIIVVGKNQSCQEKHC